MKEWTILDWKIGFLVHSYVYIQILRPIGRHGGQISQNYVAL